MSIKIDEIYMISQVEVNEFLRKNPTKEQVLDKIFNYYRKEAGFSRKIELLKQYCKENGIIGRSEDLELYNSSSASFEYNDDILTKELEIAENKVKEIKTKLKALPTTVKNNKKTIAIKVAKEVADNIKSVQ